MAARVSAKTVSRVINNDSHVSRVTRARVQDVVARLGYRPNPLARGLATRKTRSVGLVIADINNPFFPEVVRGIEDQATPRGYHVILLDTDEDRSNEARSIEFLLAEHVDGLIVCGSRAPGSILLDVARRLPLVLINRMLPGQVAWTVMTDNYLGGHRATSHLLSLGHRRIGYLGGPALSQASRQRLRGYRAALRDYGLPYDPRLIAAGRPEISGGRDVAARVIGMNEPPTALFAYDDLMAIGAVEEITRRGLRVPEDVAVVGFDDIELAKFATPPLTTVSQPKYQLGREATRLLLALLNEEHAPRRRTVVLPPTLIVRTSCGAGLRTPTEPVADFRQRSGGAGS